jgi:hypothetical protein
MNFLHQRHNYQMSKYQIRRLYSGQHLEKILEMSNNDAQLS